MERLFVFVHIYMAFCYASFLQGGEFLGRMRQGKGAVNVTN